MWLTCEIVQFVYSPPNMVLNGKTLSFQELHFKVYCSGSNAFDTVLCVSAFCSSLLLFYVQMVSTCNAHQSFFADWFLGHLNFQIEHQ